MTNTATATRPVALVPSLFDFNGYDIRVVTIKGDPWFVAADICKALGLTNTANRVEVSVSSKDTKREKLKGQRGLPTILVSEAGQYKLVMRSDKPNAKSFQDWVTGTVLPRIRKDGGYVMGEEKVAAGEMSEEAFILKAYDMLRAKVDRIAAERDALHAELYYLTIAEYTAQNHVYLTQSQKNRLSARARKLTLEAGMQVTKQDRVVPVRGQMIDTQVNVYERPILDRATRFGKLEPEGAAAQTRISFSPQVRESEIEYRCARYPPYALHEEEAVSI